MPTYAALKRAERRKFKAKAKLSFGSTSRGPSNPPSRVKADLPDLFTRPEVQQKGEEGVRRCDDSEDRTKGAAPNCCSNHEKAEKVVSEMRVAESSFHRIKPMDGNEWEDSPKKSTADESTTDASESTTDASSFNFEGNNITSREAESDAFADSYAADIARLLRKALKNGPSLEGGLLSALSPSQVQYVVHAYGSLAAFMDHRPEFELAQEGPYTLVDYEDLDGEECDCSGSSHSQA
ncbi:hypothetical protein MTO96_031006 [Rhipicephalus appendiculatus]